MSTKYKLRITGIIASRRKHIRLPDWVAFFCFTNLTHTRNPTLTFRTTSFLTRFTNAFNRSNDGRVNNGLVPSQQNRHFLDAFEQRAKTLVITSCLHIVFGLQVHQ